MDKTKFDSRIEEATSAELAKSEPVTEAQVLAEMAKDDAALHQGKKKAVHRAWVWLVTCMGWGAIGLFVVVLWHLLAPEGWRWLKQVEVEHLATGFFSALIGYMARSVQKFI